MNRLTTRDNFGKPQSSVVLTCECDYDNWFEDVLNKLAYYEDKEESNGWISVKKKLPKDNDRVLAFTESNRNADIGGISVQWGWCCKRKIMDITHWQPLPEPPKEKNEESIL